MIDQLLSELEIVSNYIFDKNWKKIEEKYGSMGVKLLVQRLRGVIRNEIKGES